MYNRPHNKSNSAFLVDSQNTLMITLQQLKVFYTVARRLHFTRAAEDLNLTQPAITFHIRSLQRQLQLRLFDVQAHEVRLTAAGELLLQRASEILNAVDGLERDMHEFAQVQGGWLKLGATLTIGNYVLPGVLASFQREYPRIKLSVEIANTACMEQGLLARNLDLALVEWRIDSPEIELIPFQTDELVVAVPVTHPFGELSEVEVDRLIEEPLILREPGSGTRALALEGIRSTVDRLNVVLELDSPEAIKRCVQAGLGVTIISETIIRAELERKVIARLRLAGCPMKREFSLAYLRARSQSPAARAFTDFVLRGQPDPGRSSKGVRR